MGNSPPEINVADSPEIAVRFGSASVRTTPALSIARRVAVTDGRPALFKAAAAKPLPETSGALFAVNGLLLLKSTDRGAVIHAGTEIDAHLLDDVPPHFRDGDLEHHLVAAADDDRVDDLFGAADQPCGDIAGLLGLDRTDTEPVRTTLSPTPSIWTPGTSASARRARR